MQNKDTCLVCGMSWSDHGLGGNCLLFPKQHDPDEKPKKRRPRRRKTNKDRNAI